MPVYEWQQRATRHFGQVWVPIAELHLQDTSGRLQGVALQIDSGAVVSLLRRSMAELLGIRLESGRRLDLTVVGSSVAIAYLHMIRTHFGEQVREVRFAIATSESVPNLLGRLDVFDFCYVGFDAARKQTKFDPVAV